MSVKAAIIPTELDQIRTEIHAALEPARQVMVVSHVDPDGDALGTQLAFGAFLRWLGKTPLLLRESVIPDKYRFLPDVSSIVRPEDLPADSAMDAAVVLECPALSRVGTPRRFMVNGLSVVNIDHHQDNSHFGTVNWVNRSASSVGEMTYELFQAFGFPVDEVVAEQLYTAILTDTGRFRFQATSPRTFQIAGELVAAGADPRRICDHVYFSALPSTMKLTGEVLSTIEYHAAGAFCTLEMTQAMLIKSGAGESESDGLVDYTMQTRGVMAGVLFKEVTPNATKASLRSNNGIDVSLIAGRFGGGGHFNAAGCIVPQGISSAKEVILTLLEKARHELD